MWGDLQLLSLIHIYIHDYKLISGLNDVLEVFEGTKYNELYYNAQYQLDVYKRQHMNNIMHTHLIGDALQLRRILVNLLTNAIKYNKPNRCV